MKIENLTLDELKCGYTKQFECVLCGKKFNKVQAVKKHMETEHADYLEYLIHLDSKYNTLTKKQQDILTMFASGMGNKEVAEELGVALSTVRQLRFQFREKAKQAKLYLAVYENIFSSAPTEDSIIPVHATANMLDERFAVTEKEREDILRNSFTSTSPLKLSVFPRKEKKKVVILTRIAEEFEKGRRYTEKEVNEILKNIYDDFTTIRRYLVDYGFIERNTMGSEYWKGNK